MMLYKIPVKRHLPPNQPFRLVVCQPFMIPILSLANWDLGQAYVLHHGSDYCQATGFLRKGVNRIRKGRYRVNGNILESLKFFFTHPSTGKHTILQ
jgi:hypothetical protein